ncbi:cytochrome p450 [Trichoderma cornu-damae]|uniref:Cytochrome p450 n=1 Tax=Trichoderma cornu-damae TaxID=654480 RepID=A0A9P8QN41_9HYPO|nr:cytochrome p450 [Trichoderma cornu-damae]
MSVVTDASTVTLKLKTTLKSHKEYLLEALLVVVISIVAQFQRTTQATSRLSRRIGGLLYLFWGPELIDRAYDKARGKAFKVSTPSNDHLLITSTDLIRELIDAPLQQLSLHAAAKEPKYTMYSFEWQDQRGVEGTGFVRALRSLLTSHLPKFQPDLERVVKGALETELKDVQPDGFAHANIFPLMKRLVTRVNCFIFFGEELSQNAGFTASALEFPQAVIFAAEFLRITPEFLMPLVASVATNRHKAAKTLYRYLVPIVEQRLAARDLQPNEAAPFGLDQSINWPWLPLLDSFIKESVRCSNSDAITCRRKALVPYTFQDGSSINKGDWACIPQRAMMRDSTRYRDSQTFDGFRFARANAQLRQHKQSADVPDQKESSLTDASPDWPIWGFGNTACPGRFYASLVTKLVLIRILDDWECKMPDPEAPRARTWRSSMVPRASTIVMFRQKQHQ